MTSMNCPYCDAEMEAGPWCHDNENGDYFDRECDACGKNFVFSAESYWRYSTRVAACLNGEAHEWEWERYWRYCLNGGTQSRSKWQRCKNCAEILEKSPQEQ